MNTEDAIKVYSDMASQVRDGNENMNLRTHQTEERF